MNILEFTSKARGVVLKNKTFNKIFCIGANKTGTTTLEFILKSYGYKLPNQQIQEIAITQKCYETDYEAFKKFVKRFDAFQDRPFSHEQTYVVADALFPNSKFILTEREPEKWFESLKSHHKRIYNLSGFGLTEDDVKKKFNYLYKGYAYQNKRRFLSEFTSQLETNWQNIYKKEYYIQEFNLRNAQIKKYFMDAPEKLLVLDITKESTTKKICHFLNIPEDLVVKTPILNKRP